jgi:signal transduction histidine kinase
MGQPSGHVVLVVDDQEETLASVRQLLEREGHRVLTAQSADEALALFGAHDVHLLLVDYFMPRVTGEELVRAIRRFDPYVQIILQTGYAGEKPPRQMLAELDIQGYHDKADGPEMMLQWVDVGLKAFRRVHALRERERLQGELVAHASHQLGAPLALISGACEMLRDGTVGELPNAAMIPLEAMERTVSGLSELVSDLLYYARLEADVVAVTREPVSLRTLATTMKRYAERVRDKKGLAIRVETFPAVIHTDGAKLACILRHLVGNAVKFTADGSVALRIERRESVLAFAVADTGTGIAPGDQETVFEAFRQLDGSSTRRWAGVGLGLALSRRLAQMLGGAIAVESQLGVGSTFTLTLPLATLDLNEAEASPRGAGIEAHAALDDAAAAA